MRLLVLMIALVATLAHPAAAEDAPFGRASIADAAWLSGVWDGEGMGGRVQEAWSAPVGGQMIGHFALSHGGKPSFYLTMLIDEHEGVLRFRVKHIDPAFVTREAGGEATTFEFVKTEPGLLVFDGMTLRRDGADGLVIDLRMVENGVPRNLIQTYRRATP
jgi:hypothetical protein